MTTTTSSLRDTSCWFHHRNVILLILIVVSRRRHCRFNSFTSPKLLKSFLTLEENERRRKEVTNESLCRVHLIRIDIAINDD